MTPRCRRSLFAVSIVGLLAAAFSGVGPAQALAPTSVFAPYLNHDVGNAQAVAIGDFTGDGRNDVVVSTEQRDDMSRPNHVYLFAQGPDGWMSRVEALETQNSWMPDLGLAAGDLDGDGKTDAVVANGHALDVFFQRNGSLAEGRPIALEGAQLVKAVDIDGDGKVDLVSSASVGLVVLKGLGAGTFAPPVVVTAQRQAEVEVGDVTGDGRRDLVTCNGIVAQVFAQQAGGTFAAPTQHSGGANCDSVALADVNGDGRTDVSITGGGNVPSSRLDVFAQRANGTLAEPTAYPTSDLPASVKAGDMNGDGRADLVVAHDAWMWVGVHAQGPDRTLDPERLTRVPYNNGTSPHRMAIGDVNGDQRPDIVIADDQHGLVTLWGQPAAPSTTTSTVRLATTVATTPPVGAPRPLFSAPQDYDLAAAGQSVVSGDFNGDGRNDVALSTRYRGDPSAGDKVFVFYQAADGSLPKAVSFDTELALGVGDVMVLAAGDLDGDGRTDLVLRMRDGINVFMQRNGTFADRTYIELPYASRVDVADLDGDGRADMVMTGLGVTVYRSLGAGTFAPPVTVLPEYRSDMAIGDVTGDGRPDLVTINNMYSSAAVEVVRQLPDGSFGAVERTSIDANPAEIAIGDLTGDGKLDVAATYEAGIQVVGIRILVQGAGGSLTPGQDVAAFAAGPLRAGDVDGDGRTDLVAMYGSRAGVWLQQAGGQLGAEQPYNTSGPSMTPSSGVVLADFTGDRRLDIAAADVVTGLDVLRNTSTGVPPQLGGATGSTFRPLTPQRLLDTRSGLGAPAARLAPGGTISLQVTGAGGVPAAGVSAVVMNVTVTEPSAISFLTAWPAGDARPLAFEPELRRRPDRAQPRGGEGRRRGQGRPVQQLRVDPRHRRRGRLVRARRRYVRRAVHPGNAGARSRHPLGGEGRPGRFAGPPGRRPGRRAGIGRVGCRAQRHRHRSHGHQLPDRLAGGGGQTAGLQPQLRGRANRPQPRGGQGRLRRQGRPFQRRRCDARRGRRGRLVRDRRHVRSRHVHARRPLPAPGHPRRRRRQGRADRHRPSPGDRAGRRAGLGGVRRRAERHRHRAHCDQLPHRLAGGRGQAAGVEPQLRRRPDRAQPGGGEGRRRRCRRPVQQRRLHPCRGRRRRLDQLTASGGPWGRRRENPV